MRSRGDGDHAVSHRDRRQHERNEADQRRLVGADDPHHAPRLVHRQRDEARLGRVHRAVVLVGEASVVERAPHGGLDFGARLARSGAGLGDAAARRIPRRAIRGSRRDSRAPGRGCAPSPRPSSPPSPPPRPRCARPCGCRARRGRRLCLQGRAPRRCSRSPAAPACRRCRAWRCGRSRRRQAPARGRAGRSARP